MIGGDRRVPGENHVAVPRRAPVTMKTINLLKGSNEIIPVTPEIMRYTQIQNAVNK
jgi:hypothetical protein